MHLSDKQIRTSLQIFSVRCLRGFNSSLYYRPACFAKFGLGASSEHSSGRPPRGAYVLGKCCPQRFLFQFLSGKGVVFTSNHLGRGVF